MLWPRTPRRNCCATSPGRSVAFRYYGLRSRLEGRGETQPSLTRRAGRAAVPFPAVKDRAKLLRALRDERRRSRGRIEPAPPPVSQRLTALRAAEPREG